MMRFQELLKGLRDIPDKHLLCLYIQTRCLLVRSEVF